MSRRVSTPSLKLGSHLVPGLAAVALFVVLAVVFLSSTFPLDAARGFPDGAAIISSIGYAMFNIGRGDVASEGFLAVFELVDVVLVAALTGAVMLGRTEAAGDVKTALTDGGRDVADRLRGGER
ncbi:proton-conducting membrane transporter [Halobaculum sp. D14]|uniref:proton-conducting membrane transporter n=1 Tax=unclassified Halobaculum TaxID=2640896 RepID=UPI003EC04EA7